VDTTTVPPNARQARCHSGLDSAECTTLRSLSRFLKLCQKVSYKQQGIALSLHGHPRFTTDVDLLVQPQGVERIVTLLALDLGFKFDAGQMPFGQGNQQHFILRITKIVGQDSLILDLLIVAPILEELWVSREIFAWRDQRLPVVSAKGLAKMKRLVGRPQDLVDLTTLGFAPNEPAIKH
ncbi:MAG: hypothetical protein NT013_05880, partial [Planctomycetia bacterium]|nr:hypothetical protein [Planctomycetia bacterium]